MRATGWKNEGAGSTGPENCQDSAGNAWLPTSASDQALLQLVCLPYAGGGAAAYYRWRPALPETIALLPVCLPGRENRLAEPAITEMESLVGPLADALSSRLDRPYALVGHSMGATIAFELARELRRRSLPAARLLVVAASPAPDSRSQREAIHELPDDEFLAEVQQRFHAIPTEVTQNTELLQLLLPTLRADVKLYETYQFYEEPPLECDVLALGGTTDSEVSPAQLHAWQHHTRGRFTERMFPGDHFFLFGDAESAQRPIPAVQWICQKLQSCMGRESRP